MYIWDLDFVKVLKLNERGGLNCKGDDEVFLLANGSLPKIGVRCPLANQSVPWRW